MLVSLFPAPGIPPEGRLAPSIATVMEARIDSRKFKKVTRRELLKLAPVLAVGAFAIPRLQQPLLKAGLGFSDWASAYLFRSGHLAATLPDSDVVPFEKFPINGYDVADPGVDLEKWTLAAAGAVQKAGNYTLAQIPVAAQDAAKHPARLRGRMGCHRAFRRNKAFRFPEHDRRGYHSRSVTVECADDYYESLDMATALHPQTLLCYEMYDQPLTREHGAPLRLSIPTKVGYKQAKYITDLKVTNVLERVGYWEDQGYSSFYGL